jgi:hypothetical protein
VSVVFADDPTMINGPDAAMAQLYTGVRYTGDRGHTQRKRYRVHGLRDLCYAGEAVKRHFGHRTVTSADERARFRLCM